MSGSVTISSSGVPPRLKSTPELSAPARRPPPPTWTSFAASSSRWARVMPTSNSPSARQHRHVAADADRLVVLGDLVRLREVRIEVVLAVELRARRDLAAEREAGHDRQPDGLAVQHRQHARVGEADRAGVAVGRVAEAQLAAAEHLRARQQLDVDLEADHRLPAGQVDRAHATPGGEGSKPIARLERVGHVEEAVLAEGRPGDLQADRQAVGRGRTGSRWPGCPRG